MRGERETTAVGAVKDCLGGGVGGGGRCLGGGLLSGISDGRLEGEGEEGEGEGLARKVNGRMEGESSLGGLRVRGGRRLAGRGRLRQD